MYATTPGWDVRPWYGCMGLGFSCAPPLVAWGVGVCVFFCACSPCTPPLVAGVCGVGACEWVRVSAVPRHSWLGCWDVCVLVCTLPLYPASLGWGVQCACVCLCARSACTLTLLAGVCSQGVCVGARVLAAPRHSWLGCRGVRVCVRALLVPRHSSLGCAAWVCVLGLRFRLSYREGGLSCLRTTPHLGGTLGIHRTSWRIPFRMHACMFLVLGF